MKGCIKLVPNTKKVLRFLFRIVKNIISKATEEPEDMHSCPTAFNSHYVQLYIWEHWTTGRVRKLERSQFRWNKPTVQFGMSRTGFLHTAFANVFWQQTWKNVIVSQRYVVCFIRQDLICLLPKFCWFCLSTQQYFYSNANMTPTLENLSIRVYKHGLGLPR